MAELGVEDATGLGLSALAGPVGLALGGVSILGGRRAKKKAKRKAKRLAAQQRALALERAKQIKIQAGQRIQRIKSEAIRVRGRQVAQQASKGVIVGNGSAQAMVDETTRLAEEDAFITWYNGERGYLTEVADANYRFEEQKAQANTIGAQANASLLSGASGLALQSYSLFKKPA